jgi:hypothetical protein
MPPGRRVGTLMFSETYGQYANVDVIVVASQVQRGPTEVLRSTWWG